MSGNSRIRYRGTGPGPQTLDGCSVEFYRRLPAASEPAIVASQVTPPATLLELGCGTGRLTHPLLDLGFDVTAVDNSAAMLAHVQGATKVLSDIETLALGRTFDSVLLASRILNVPCEETRQALLQTVHRHLHTDGGVFLAEVHTPAILQHAAGDASTGPHYAGRILAAESTGTHASITIEYTIEDKVWQQSFETEYLPEPAVIEALRGAGLRFDGWIDEARSWFRASAA